MQRTSSILLRALVFPAVDPLCRSSTIDHHIDAEIILLRLHPYYRASPDDWQRRRGKLRLETKIVFHRIDPIRVVKEGRGLCVSGQNHCVRDDSIWILDEFINLFFLSFTFGASDLWILNHMIGLKWREWCRRHYAVNHLRFLSTTADAGCESAILRRTWEPGFIFYPLTWPPRVLWSHLAGSALCVLHHRAVCTNLFS